MVQGKEYFSNNMLKHSEKNLVLFENWNSHADNHLDENFSEASVLFMTASIII